MTTPPSIRGLIVAIVLIIIGLIGIALTFRDVFRRKMGRHDDLRHISPAGMHFPAAYGEARERNEDD